MLLQLLPKMQGNLDNRVCVIIGRGEIGKKLEEWRIPVYYLELKNILDLKVIFRYYKVLKRFIPDVQVNYLIHADIFGRIFGRIFKIKKIVSYIRNIHKAKKLLMFLDRSTLLLSSFILTNSETSRKYYMKKMGAKKNKIACIPNGFNLSRIKKIKINNFEKRKEIGISNKAILIGSIARMEKQKDIPTLLKAFKIVQKKHSKARLLLIGHGSQEKYIKTLSENLDVFNEVMMLKKRVDVLELISIMDIFILPSLNEGMSNALLEAMAMKKVIITSDICENVELVKNEIDGLNFEKENYDNLADKIMEVMEGKHDIESFKKNAFEKVRDNYDLEIIKNAFENFLLKI